MILSQEDIYRFWSNVDQKVLNECWPWTGCRRHGYGGFQLNGRMEQAHRVSWTLINGLIPDLFEGLSSEICHSCDNPICCNPNHLFPGNQAINMKDCVDKGRHSFPRPRFRGELHPNVRITETQVKQIKERRQRGETLKQIAKIYGIG